MNAPLESKVDKSTFGPKPELGWLPAAQLHADSTYQRSMATRRSERLIENICAEFTWFLFGTLIVVKGLADYLIIDGQHRNEGAKRRGIVEVPTALFPTMSLARQAKAFVDANRLRIAVSPYAVFHAQVTAGDPAARTVADICAEAGVSIPRAPGAAQHLKPGETLAIGAVKALIGTHGGAVAVATLSTLREAMTEPGALRAHYINALGNLVRSRPEVSLPRLRAAIAAQSLESMEKAVLTHVLEKGTTRITAAECLFLRLLELPEQGVAAAPVRLPSALLRDTLAVKAPGLGTARKYDDLAPRKAEHRKPVAVQTPRRQAEVEPSEETDAENFTIALQRRCPCNTVFKTKRASQILCDECTRRVALPAAPRGRAGA